MRRRGISRDESSDGLGLLSWAMLVVWTDVQKRVYYDKVHICGSYTPLLKRNSEHVETGTTTETDGNNCYRQFV